MGLNWKTEEQDLIHIKKIIARAWRMNQRQLRAYCVKLRKNRQEILPGPLGGAFLMALERISRKDTGVPQTIWPDMMMDAERLRQLIQDHAHLDQERWLAAIPKLESGQNQYFRTGLGRVFVRVAKEKTGMGVTEQRQPAAQSSCALVGDNKKGGVIGKANKTQTADTTKNVLRSQSCMADKKHPAKRNRWNARRIPRMFGRLKQAAVPVLAGLSVCFMAVWLRGQVARSQNQWNIQQMKTAAAEETGAFMAEHPSAEIDTINYNKELSGTDISIADGHAVKGQQAGTQPENQQTDAQPENQQTGTQPENQQTGTQPENQQTGTQPEILPQYREMSEQYPQLYGWLQIPGMQIDFPVMQPEGDGNFYLHHDFTGAPSAEGTLFVDPKSCSDPKEKDQNTVVYGHNMKNGHIFGMLNQYGNPDFFEAHREIHFDTLYETGVYEAAAVLKTRILNENEPGFRYYQFYHYKNEDEFQECLDFVEANQVFETDAALQYGDQILMLSTCEYSQENGRLVVVARKIG